MKKLLASILALLMALTFVTASANTVYTMFTIDEEVAREILPGFGVTDDQIAAMEPLAALVNALAVYFTNVEDGVQIDLELNETPALTVGVATNDAGVNIVSTLFPYYIVTMKNETFGTIMQQMTAMMSGSAGDVDVAASAEALGSHFAEFVETCGGAVHMGKPQPTEYDVDYDYAQKLYFDTVTPVAVDSDVIIQAWGKLTEDLLNDGTIAAIIGSSAQISGQTPDVEQLRATLKELEARFPTVVTAEYYTNSGDSEQSFLSIDLGYEGQGEPPYWLTILNKNAKEGSVGFVDFHHPDMSLGANYSEENLFLEYVNDDEYYALGCQLNDDFSLYELYLMYRDAPVITLGIGTYPDGERSLPVDAAGKTVLAVEDVMGDASGEAVQGLLADIQAHGLGELMGVLSSQVPEIAGLATVLTGTGYSDDGIEEAPDEADEPSPEEVDPAEWETLADVLSLDADGYESSWDDEEYTYIFGYAGTKYVVTADFSKELEEAMNAVDFMADDREEQINAILGPCEITSAYDMSMLAIPQNELDQWIGKTGQALLDDGWEYNGYTYEGDSLGIHMINGRIEYAVSFEEEIEAPADFDDEPDYAGATISSIRFSGNSYHFFDPEYVD